MSYKQQRHLAYLIPRLSRRVNLLQKAPVRCRSANGQCSNDISSSATLLMYFIARSAAPKRLTNTTNGQAKPPLTTLRLKYAPPRQLRLIMPNTQSLVSSIRLHERAIASSHIPACPCQHSVRERVTNHWLSICLHTLMGTFGR